MKLLDTAHLERLRNRLENDINRIDDFYIKLIEKKKFSFTALRINDYSKSLIQMSMIVYRVDKEPLKSLGYVVNANDSIVRMQNLQSELEILGIEGLGVEPNCINLESLEPLCFVAFLNKSHKSIEVVNKIYTSRVVSGEGAFPFAQQYTPLLLLGALDKKEEFESAYQTFKELNKSYFEEGLSLYIDMLAAIVSREQALFDDLHQQAEAAMQSHATDKKWGDDFMTGGHEYNAIAYDYRGTALCCLAKLKDMQVNHFSCYYPQEIIERG